MSKTSKAEIKALPHQWPCKYHSTSYLHLYLQCMKNKDIPQRWDFKDALLLNHLLRCTFPDHITVTEKLSGGGTNLEKYYNIEMITKTHLYLAVEDMH